MFKKPFLFEGRIRRTEYGLSFLLLIFGRVTLAMLLTALTSGQDIRVIYFILQLPLVWFFLAQGAKRCHDVGWNGWLQLIPLVPIYLIFGDGQKEENKYGVNPKNNSENF